MSDKKNTVVLIRLSEESKREFAVAVAWGVAQGHLVVITLAVLFWILFGSCFAHAQGIPNILPPDETYITDGGGPALPWERAREGARKDAHTNGYVNYYGAPALPWENGRTWEKSLSK